MRAKPHVFQVLDYLRIPENASQVLESLAWFRLELLPIFTNLFLPDTALAREELHRHVALEHFIARGVRGRVLSSTVTDYDIIPNEYCLTD